jgi:hypothetical protein
VKEGAQNQRYDQAAEKDFSFVELTATRDNRISRARYNFIRLHEWLIGAFLHLHVRSWLSAWLPVAID